MKGGKRGRNRKWWKIENFGEELKKNIWKNHVSRKIDKFFLVLWEIQFSFSHIFEVKSKESLEDKYHSPRLIYLQPKKHWSQFFSLSKFAFGSTWIYFCEKKIGENNPVIYMGAHCQIHFSIITQSELLKTPQKLSILHLKTVKVT